MRFYTSLGIALASPILALVAILYILHHGFTGYLSVFAVLAGIGLLVDLDRRRRRMAGTSDEESEVLSFGSLAVATRAAPGFIQAVGVDLLGTASAMAGLVGIAILATWVGHVGVGLQSAGKVPSLPAAAPLPAGIAVDGQGSLYLTDESSLRVARLLPAGGAATQWGEHGTIGGFRWPVRIALGPSQRIYVSDARAGMIDEFSARGSRLASWHMPHVLDEPTGLAFDRYGNLYVALAGVDRIQKLSPQGKPLASFGGFGDEPGQFDEPTGLAVDRSGDIYVVDTLNNRVQKFSPSFEPVASWGRIQDDARGDFAHPTGIAVDLQGNVYIADTDNHRIQKFSARGRLLAVWGGYGHGKGSFDGPHGIAVDRSGDIFVADTFNHRIVKLSPAGHVLATYLSAVGDAGVPGIAVHVTVRGNPARHVPPLVAWFHVFAP